MKFIALLQDIRKDQAELREDNEFSCTDGQKPGNFLRNRYRDILPCEFRLVILFTLVVLQIISTE